jgi:hypothetical protein
MTRVFADIRARPCPKKLPFKPLRLDRSIGNATGGHRSTTRDRIAFSLSFFLRPLQMFNSAELAVRNFLHVRVTFFAVDTCR